MNQRRAKILRREIYGDLSRRGTQYKKIGAHLVCIGLREKYKERKKHWKRNHR